MSAPQPSVIAIDHVDAASCSATLTGVIGPNVGGQVQLGLLHVRDDHLAAAAGQRGQRRHHADGPGAHDHGHVARLDLRLDGGVHAHGQRLHHRALGKAHVVRQLEGEVGRMHHRRAATRRGRAAWPRNARPGPGCTCPAASPCCSGRGCPAPCRPGRPTARCVTSVADLHHRARRPRGPAPSARAPRTGRWRRACSSARRCRRCRPCGWRCARRRDPAASSTSMSRRVRSSFFSKYSAFMPYSLA